MKKARYLMLIGFIVVNCNPEPETVTIITIEGYFVKSDVSFKEDVKHLYVSNKQDFDQHFGIPRSMIDRATLIDFEKEHVGVIMLKPQHESRVIKLIHSEVIDGRLVVTYKIVKGERQPFKSTSANLFSFLKKHKHIEYIEFIDGEQTYLVKL